MASPKLIKQLSTFHIAKLYYHNVVTDSIWFSEQTVEASDTIALNYLPSQEAYRVVINQCFHDSAIRPCLFDEYLKIGDFNGVPVKLTNIALDQRISIHIDKTQFPSLVQTQQEIKLMLKIRSQQRMIKSFYSTRVREANKRKREYIDGFQKQVQVIDDEIQACKNEKREKRNEIIEMQKTLDSVRSGQLSNSTSIG